MMFHKVKLIFRNKRVQKCLFTSSIAATAFFAGTHYEKNNSLSRLSFKNYPALPIFANISITDEPIIEEEERYYDYIVNTLNSLAQKLQVALEFNSVKAATPITEPSVPVLLPNADPSKTKPNRVSQIMKHGFPGLDNVRSFDDFVLSYDRRNRVPHWVFEHLTLETVKKNDEVDRAKCEFTPDESIHPLFRSQNADYKHSGYDRGHMAAAGNHKCHQKHVEQTFYLTNIAPQVGKGFNRDSWNRLEKHVRKLTKTYMNVYCCTGPLYLPRREANGKHYVKYEVIGANHVAVPTHFYKIVVGETKDGIFEMESYVMPNEVIDDNIPLQNFQVPPESIEKASGLLFFNNLTKKNVKKINGKKN